MRLSVQYVLRDWSPTETVKKETDVTSADYLARAVGRAFGHLHDIVVVDHDGADGTGDGVGDVDVDADVEIDGQREPQQADADEPRLGPAAERRPAAAAQRRRTVHRRHHRRPDRHEWRHQAHVRHTLNDWATFNVPTNTL